MKNPKKIIKKCFFFNILCFLCFSNIEEIIAKFAQLTPQERAKRYGETHTEWDSFDLLVFVENWDRITGNEFFILFNRKLESLEVCSSHDLSFQIRFLFILFFIHQVKIELSFSNNFTNIWYSI